MKIVDSLHAYVWQGRDNNCNSYLFSEVLEGGRHVLIDPGHIVTPYLQEPALEWLFQAIQGDGIESTAIGAVVLTHFHPDHCEAANRIREENQALVAIHPEEEPVYARLGGMVDGLLEEGDLLLDGQNPAGLKVYHTPGHSPGHVAIYWPQQKALIAGDLIFYRSTGRVDLPGGSPRQLVKSIEKLSELEVDYLLCGHAYGHPGVLTGREEVRQNFDFLKANVLF